MKEGIKIRKQTGSCDGSEAFVRARDTVYYIGGPVG